MDNDYAEKSLKIIHDNEILSKIDLKSLSLIKDELQHNFKVGQLFRSRVEMEVSVLNDVKHPTADAKYWQSVREQMVHFDQLVGLSYEYRKNIQRIKILEVEIEELKLKKLPYSSSIENKKIDAEVEIKKIDIEKLKWILIQMSKTAKDRIREIINWHEIMELLKPHMKYSIDNYEDHQWASHKKRFDNQLNTAIKVGNNISSAEANNMVGLCATMDRVISNAGVIVSGTEAKELKEKFE